jgi:hypothetical protein
MKRPRGPSTLLAAALPWLAACAGARPGEPWVAEFAFDDPGLGRQRTALALEVEEGQALAGGSRFGAMSAVTGSGLVGVYERVDPGHGSLVEIDASGPVREGEVLELSLSSPLGELHLRGTWSRDGYRGRWTGEQGAGAFAWTPRTGEGRLDEYPAVLAAFVDALEQRCAFPARLADPAWRAQLAEARERAVHVADDFEFVGLVLRLCEPIAPSCVCLRQAHRPESTRVKVAFEKDVAVLTPTSIADGVDAIDQAFADARGARALVLDLRGVVGYDLTVGRLVAHLASSSEPAGYMLGRKRADDGPLSETTRDLLPRLAGVYNESVYRTTLGVVGAAAAVTEVVDEPFTGPVAVLIDRATRGGVEPVAELLQRTGRATLVGEPTAGASVDAELVPLPGGWTALVPVATWVTWDGRWMERTPVEPDVRVAAASALTRALRLLD